MDETDRRFSHNVPKKILLVDDEAHVRMFLEQILEELEEDFGAKLWTASNGREALGLMVEHNISCVMVVENERPVQGL